MEEQAPQKAYELRPEEIEQLLSFTENGRRYRVKHFFRPPTLDDWAAYDAALGVTVQDVDLAGEVGRAHHDNRTAAMLLLWQRLIARVEGYAFSEESGGSSQESEWKGKVPVAHRLGAVSPRALVFAVAPGQGTGNREQGTEESALYTPGLQEVHLLAAGGDYLPLVHSFRQPGAAETVEFNRLSAERIYVRGRAGAKAVIPSLLRQYCVLYDALIESVRGYTLTGDGALTREQIVSAMDAWHKQAAVKALFIPPQPEPPQQEPPPQEPPQGE